MTESRRDNLAKLGNLEVLLYLFIIPMCFTYAVHFISSKSANMTFQKEIIIKADMNKLNSYVTDFKVFRELLPFYRDETKYTKISDTNDAFNYSLPILGAQEMKIIKAKEEMKYITQAEKVQTVEEFLHRQNTTSVLMILT